MRSLHRQALTVMASLMVGAAMGACSSGPSPTVLKASGMTLLVSPGSGEAMDAGIAGTLALTHAKCVGLAGPDGKVRVAIWPHGSALTSGGIQVGGGGPALSVGDSLRGGGGVIDLPSKDYPDIPAECEPGTSVLVLSSVKGG